MIAVKLIPHLLSWFGIVLLFLRGFPRRRAAVAFSTAAGFVVGAAVVFVLYRAFPVRIPVGIIKTTLGASFLFLWFLSVAAIYRGAASDFPLPRMSGFADSRLFAGFAAIITGMVAGGVSACRLSAAGGSIQLLLLALAAISLVFAAVALERVLPSFVTVSQTGLATAVVALLLFSSSSIIRLDLFSPMSMKVMKGVHDFVHQSMESVLVPDHLFVRPTVWKYIGFLFGKEVGFWGGMIIWFTPAILVALAIQLERLPSVAHIRQGAQRRRQLAGAIRARRFRLIVPLLALAVFAGAAYQSSFPSVEYWDPKPLPVTATPAGEIVIPKKGEVDLEDGKLHKFIFRQGDKEARFFVLMTPAGHLTVDLDACAICKPDGYGQTEGTVICYYCKTLIPLETVGRPGGCNPVPVSFSEKEGAVHIDGITLINSWSTTVQATSRIKEGGK